MGTGDGTVLGTTKIHDSGPDDHRFNIVLLAEGFQNTTNDQNDFNNRCNDFVTTLLDEPWFDSLMNAINIHRVNIGSTDQGADDPATCAGGAGTTADTYFDATYCGDGQIQRLLTADWGLVRDTCDDEVPEWHIGVILVNSGIWGGAASGNVASVAMVGGWINIILHEIGHSAFGLADEYNYWEGCGIDTTRDNAPDGEPSEPNVTTVKNRSSLKWRHLVDPSTPIPTMENPDCSQCDGRANVLDDMYEAGLFEGAKYYHCGRYRPSYSCRMKESNRHFCRVCIEAIHDVLRQFFGTTPVLGAELSTLDFGSIGRGAVRTERFEISNLGTADITSLNLIIDNVNYTANVVGSGSGLSPGDVKEIEVTLGPVFVDGLQNGTLQIQSNAATLDIELTGTIRPPNPRIQVVTPDGGTMLDFGDVCQGLTMYKVVEIRNLQNNSTAPLHVTLGTPTGEFSYAPGTVVSFVLPAPEADESYTSKSVFVSFRAPYAGGPNFNGTLNIDAPDDTTDPSTTLQLSGRSIPVPDVDTVLVLDRSGSMSGETGDSGNSKIDHAIYASNLYISLMNDGDKIGVVRYNDHSDEAHGDLLLDLVDAGPLDDGDGRRQARLKLNINDLAPHGMTSIGAGIILGSDVLDGASANSRALVVLTDGRQNTDPTIVHGKNHVLAKIPSQRVFGVGLGLNQLEDSLHEIATVTNGTAQITGDLVDEKEFILQKLFVQILSDVSDNAFIRDPRCIVQPSGKEYSDINIGETDLSADFIVVFRTTHVFPKYMDTWLEAPDGTIITIGDALNNTHPNVSTGSGTGHRFFRLQFPTFPDRPRAHIGRWRLWVENLTNPSSYGSSPLYYSIMAKARSDLMLKGRLTQEDYVPGSEMRIILEPNLYGRPVELDPPCEVRIERPDGVWRRLELSANVYGSYEGIFTDTSLVGPYRVEADVQVTTPAGIQLNRYRHMSGMILGPKKWSEGDGKAEDCCEDMKDLLEDLIVVVKKCCCTSDRVDTKVELPRDYYLKATEPEMFRRKLG